MRAAFALLAACGGAPAPAPIANVRPGPTDPRCQLEPMGPSVAPVFENGYVISPADLARSAIRPHEGQITRCWSERAEVDPSLYGRITATIRIDTEGRAEKITMHGFDEAIDLCVCEVLLTVEYRRLRATDITVPFKFSAKR